MYGKFLNYLGPEDSIASYTKSYKLVLLKYIFESMINEGDLKVSYIAYKFREFYLGRKKKGLISDINVDKRIANVEKSSINDIISIIKVNPYNVINKRGFLYIKSNDQNVEYFKLSDELIDSLHREDLYEIVRILENKLSLYFSKIDIKKGSKDKMKKPKHRKILTPSDKLIRRIDREFPKKKFIGDIIIDDEEYLILKGYLRGGFNRLSNTYNHIIIDPVFATALVQVGIRNYDSNLWSHISDVLRPFNMSVNHHKWISDSFYSTLKKYNKPLLGESERVRNILMHGFIVNNYANSFFDFLFAYYNIDLDRDLTRNNREMMNSLIEIIMRNDNTDRTYLLVKHTQDAVTVNSRGSKIRLRRFLSLIDKCFWGQEVHLNQNNRLSRLFSEWADNSIEFKKERENREFVKGKKRFTSPYVKCNLKDASFNLVMPPQVIKTENPDNISWNIKNEISSRTYSADVYKVITGYKTEELITAINHKNLFKSITIELMDNDIRLRLFKINKATIRFFDRDGDFILRDNLPEGEVYSFTEGGYTPISDALVDSEVIGDLVRSYFDLENGDIIRLPDGLPLSIGKKLEEGLLHRGLVSNAYADTDTSTYMIYRKPPSILLKIPDRKVKGTMIRVNENISKMFEVKTTIFDLKDRSGDTGFLINLADLGCMNDGIYNVYVDVPNDRTNRIWKFVLINGIKYEFEDEPYIFNNKGTIIFNDDLKVVPNNKDIEKVKNENSFNFEITPEEDVIHFETILDKSRIHLSFNIPAFKWSFDNKTWFIQKPLDTWHNNFPTKIYIKLPENKLVLHMDDLLENDIEQSVTYIKNQSSGVIECDVTRFKSWFGREKKIRNIFMNIGNREIEYIRIITRSYVTNKMIRGDFINQELIGEFDIVGNSTYFADIIFNGKTIADKKLIEKGQITIKDQLTSGRYKVIIYEEESDDTGFGDKQYLNIYEFYQDLINPYDLTGKIIELKHLKKNGSMFKTDFKEKYVISNLILIDLEDRHNYKGLLTKYIEKKNSVSYLVKVEFKDLDNLRNAYVNFHDDNEYIEFLFDEFKKRIVRYEEDGLSPSVRYRKYTVIYDDEYSFGIEFN